jgi:hypothetical protein
MKESKKEQLERLLSAYGYPLQNTVFDDLDQLLGDESTMIGKMKIAIDYLLRKKQEFSDGYTTRKEILAIFRVMCQEQGGNNNFMEVHYVSVGKEKPVRKNIDILKEPFKNAKKELIRELRDNGMKFVNRDKFTFAYPKDIQTNILSNIKVKKTRERKRWMDEFLSHSKDLFISPQWVKMSNSGKGNAIIDFGSNSGLRNAVFLPVLYDAILEKKVLRMTYDSQYQKKTTLTFHPYFLRQYNNRWFVVGYASYRNGKAFDDDVRALDRIRKIHVSDEAYREPTKDYAHFFDDIIGVSFEPGGKKTKMEFVTHTEYAHNRILTRPLHNSQVEMKKFDAVKKEGRFSIEIIPNRELRSQLLSFGAELTVMEPSWYYGKMWEVAKEMLERYDKGEKKEQGEEV